MAVPPRVPLSVAVARAIVLVASGLVPHAQREDWKREWHAEIWHRWQFLRQVREWNLRQSLHLVRNSFGALPDAIWHLASQQVVRSRVRSGVQHPWSCLAALAFALVILGVVTSGFPATRQLLGFGSDAPSRDLLFIWLHPVLGGVDQGLPPDVVPAWASHSRLLAAVAPFNIDKARLDSHLPHSASSIVIDTEPGLFKVLPVRPQAGALPSSPALVLEHSAWSSVFHSNPHIIGSLVRLGSRTYPVAAILPASFHFLTRQPSAYLVEPHIESPSVFVVARARPGANRARLSEELGSIVEDVSYYFFSSQLRIVWFRTELAAPLKIFATAVLVAAFLTLMARRVRWKRLLAPFKAGHRGAALARYSFFAAKLGLSLLLVFTVVLEGSRVPSAVLFASRDPANGPVLVWFYIIGAMGAFFWAASDQRARCPVCLRLLAFPVRIGCPGCLLLDWSGTELLCSEGHGVLHVPYLAPSWNEESQHWVALDESWQSLFSHHK